MRKLFHHSSTSDISVGSVLSAKSKGSKVALSLPPTTAGVFDCITAWLRMRDWARSATVDLWSLTLAYQIGMWFSESRQSIGWPRDIKNAHISVLPATAAQWRGVRPSESVGGCSIGVALVRSNAWMIESTVGSTPLAHAVWSGVRPWSSSCVRQFADCLIKISMASLVGCRVCVRGFCFAWYLFGRIKSVNTLQLL